MTITVPIIVAIITAGAGLLVTALSFFLTKAKEREADWRTQKLEHYKAFMVALNAIVGPTAPTDDRVRFATIWTRPLTAARRLIWTDTTNF